MPMEFANNKVYKNWLLNSSDVFYLKYVVDVKKLLKKGNKFLDMGCGTGNVIKLLAKECPAESLYGVDISEFFINELKPFFNVSRYDGEKLPFGDGYFDITGSFTVLEHVEKPYLFLEEKIRVTKKGGYIIIACPNFLSPFNSVRGYTAKEKFARQVKYLAGGKLEMNAPIIREVFKSDDDAIVVSNLAPVMSFLKQKKLRIIHVSGIMSGQNRIISFIARISGIRLLLPSVYIIAEKTF